MGELGCAGDIIETSTLNLEYIGGEEEGVGAVTLDLGEMKGG